MVSPKVGLGNNCPMLNVYDVVSRVMKIDKYYQLTNYNTRHGDGASKYGMPVYLYKAKVVLQHIN